MSRPIIGSLLFPLSLLASAVLADNEEPIEVIQVVGESREEKRTVQGARLRGTFGFDQDLIDIPRAVTPLSAELLGDQLILDVNELNRIVPGSYGAVGFGSASLPTLRGQLGEVFTHGLRRQGGNNGFGIPLSFNSAEQIDVARGTPPVMLGTTQRVGGFLNIQPKQAHFTREFSTLSGHVGRWDHYGVQFDGSRVIEEDVLALRASVEIRDENSFYDFTGWDSQNLFVTARWRPDDVSEWNISWEYYDVEFTDNAGLNRPTQALIDEGLYITGQGRQPNGSQVPGPLAVVSPTGEVRIPRNRVLTDPDNISDARTHIFHGVYERDLGPDWQLVNRSYYENMQRENIAQNSFVEIIDRAHTAENRLELYYDYATRARIVFGSSLRYTGVRGYSQFTTEADNPIDLTGTIEQRRIPLTPEQQARFVELRPGLFVSPGGQYDVSGDGQGDFNLSDTTDSSNWQWGLFAQHDWQVTDALTISTGVRGDHYWVTARDPIPPEGFEAARDSIERFLGAAEFGVVYRVTAQLNAYGSASYMESTSNSMAGGTVLGADNRINRQNFATENELYEVGLKWSSLDTRWYADVAAYQQTRSLRNLDGSNSGIRSQGTEMQVFFVGSQWQWNGLLAYQDTRWDNSSSVQGTRQVRDVFDDSRPDIIQGTGLGSPNFTAFPPSRNRVQGLPRWTAATSARYQWNSQLRFGVDAWYSEAYPLDFLQTVWIRDQFEVNAMASYDLNPQLQLRLDILNVTNEDNWSAVFEGGYFGADLVMPNLPRHWRIRATYRF
ncbi:TonB-dependent receptor [Aliidiomarina sanyensis]|uniref:TonB-dependent receptor n=1 Tax=Aliidiomarina sanyensis TaxID=1249555 RepID=A0A432WN64_9GAMM|nr:TonB-dependent receptor [Aliidiomarina sanyensis]RUO35233.1 TonB-dependent receptor [Aliidiomarina sanyensis]